MAFFQIFFDFSRKTIENAFSEVVITVFIVRSIAGQARGQLYINCSADDHNYKFYSSATTRSGICTFT
ncbi:hypothetical protein [Pontibacter pudoricolor]|uniref:hypothetical protein n=1 Tax=Pontibacter pudoricolor TaxID=2694930 RepID=UPI00139119AA|nr:hypothetical protein [Pontibacter pudoricolor]